MCIETYVDTQIYLSVYIQIDMLVLIFRAQHSQTHAAIIPILISKIHGYTNMPSRMHLQQYITQSAQSEKTTAFQANCRYLKHMYYMHISIHTPVRANETAKA